MGVGRYTPNTAIEGDIGWRCQEEKQWVNIYRFWMRMSKMKTSRLNKHVFSWARKTNCKNWFSKVRHFFEDIGMGHICICDEDVDYDHLFSDVKVVIHEYFVSKWFQDLNRVEAKRGEGRNKLRTYRLFKDKFQPEHYLKHLSNRYHIRNFAKLRCGVAPLAIETGRFNRVKLDKRLCTFCNTNEIEDEKHVVLKCILYNDIRECLVDKCLEVCPAFNTMNEDEKFKFIFSDENIVCNAARACNSILNRRRDFIHK